MGTGRITRRLVADLQTTDGVEVTAIASRSSERAQWYADQYGIAEAVTGYQALLERDDVDAVYIALPPAMHRRWAIPAAEHGKQLLCEKPLAMSAAQATEIAIAFARANLRWLDATAWLHHERTQAFGNWLREQRFGQIGHISASVSFYRPFQSNDHRLDPALGGGCLLDLAWYCVSLIRFATGSLPTKVFASSIEEQGVSLRVNAMLWFADSVTASISCGYDTATRKWFEIAGSDASLICDDFTRPWADRPARCWIHAPSGAVEQYQFSGSQERNMIARLVGGEALSSLQQQAIDTHRVLDAMDQSCQTGQPAELAAS
jgi:predicted dehydrogenase